MQQLLDTVLDAVHRAAEPVMAIYADTSQFEARQKEDNSPLTAADMASHHSLCEQLGAATPDIPLLSEEATHAAWEERRHWTRCWLIDPLDGTKEFLKRNGEFTINVALVEDGRAILGVVHSPVLERTYYAAEGLGAWRRDGNGAAQAIHVAEPPEDRPWRVVGSRSHATPEAQAFIDQLPAAELVSMGSSLKLCLVADGTADIYPRLGPTSEWDTAAAQCVVEQAGGQVLDAQTGEPLRYNQRESLLNPHFIVCARRHPAWRIPAPVPAP